MKNAKSITLLLTGAVLGAALTGPTANAAEAFFQAKPTLSPIYVDGRQVQMEAYVINGSNYVKLRDIGQAVDLEVYWDGADETDHLLRSRRHWLHGAEIW